MILEAWKNLLIIYIYLIFKSYYVIQSKSIIYINLIK